MGSLACLLLGGAAHEVTLYEAREQRAADIAENGVRLRGDVVGTAFPRVGRAGEAAAPYDAIIVAVGAEEYLAVPDGRGSVGALYSATTGKVAAGPVTAAPHGPTRWAPPRADGAPRRVHTARL